MAKPKSICSVEGCNGGNFGRGLCVKHYFRARRASTKTVRPTVKFLMDLAASHQGDECITWPFAKDNLGRASIWYDGRTRPASRVVCEMAHGPAPTSGMDAAHSCGNGHLACVNPSHLRWATRRENSRDRLLHGTHPRQTKANRRFTDDQVKAIRSDPRTLVAISAEYGVGSNTIYRIKNNLSYRSAPPPLRLP